MDGLAVASSVDAFPRPVIPDSSFAIGIPHSKFLFSLANVASIPLKDCRAPDETLNRAEIHRLTPVPTVAHLKLALNGPDLPW